MWFVLEYLLLLVLGSALAYALYSAIQVRRSAQSSLAWVLFIILVPYLAVPIFFLLGFRKTSTRYAPLVITPLRKAPPQDHPAAELLAKIGAPAAYGGQEITLHQSPAEALAALEALVEGARERLDILIYILANDASGRRFVERLTEKAKAGVAVRLNIDWLGSLRPPRRELRAFQRAGGELRYFSPLLHWADKGQLNLRNHRKLVIADNAALWAGGRNIGDDYLKAQQGAFVDLSFSLRGPMVLSFAQVFSADWDVTGGSAPPPLSEPDPAGEAICQMLPAGPDEPKDILYHGLLGLIHRANSRIWIASPYFVPTDNLAQALGLAAARGLDVRLFLPEKSDQIITDFARGPYLRRLAKLGCKIEHFQGGMLHAKAGLIDDFGWLGSANFDTRSMHLNFELTLFTYSAAEVAALDKWFSGLEPHCETGVRIPTWIRRILESIFRLGAPVL